MKGICRNVFLATIVYLTVSSAARAADDTLDPTFGTNGKVTVDFNGSPTAGQPDQDSGLDVAVQPDGKIIATGYSALAAGTGSPDNFMVVRFNGDGKADIAVFRPSTGNWSIIKSKTGAVHSLHFGTTGDIPVSSLATLSQ